MIKNNDAVPDIEKLLHSEFDLDIDEQLRLQGKGEIEIQKVRQPHYVVLLQGHRKEGYVERLSEARGHSNTNIFISRPTRTYKGQDEAWTKQWGSGTWYPLDVAPGDETEHIIAQASVTTLSFAFK